MLWSASVVTGDDGTARVPVKYPDSLTTWKAVAVGLTTDARVGNADAETVVKKNVLVRLETPRFFRERDTLTVSAIVQNYLATAKKAKVALKVEGVKIEGGDAERTVEVPPNGEVRIDWTVGVRQSTGEAKLKVEALTDEESDAMEVARPILPYGIDKFVAWSGAADSPSTAGREVAREGNVTTIVQQVEVPRDRIVATTRLSVFVAPSLAVSLRDALPFLVEYPYGCVEQTMSRFMPAAVVAKTFGDLNIPHDDFMDKKLPDVVKAGLARLGDMQRPDGGWGWWASDEPDPYMTAYVMYGLTLARQADCPVDAVKFDRGLNALEASMKKTDLTPAAAADVALVARLARGHAGLPGAGAGAQRPRHLARPQVALREPGRAQRAGPGDAGARALADRGKRRGAPGDAQPAELRRRAGRERHRSLGPRRALLVLVGRRRRIHSPRPDGGAGGGPRRSAGTQGGEVARPQPPRRAVEEHEGHGALRSRARRVHQGQARDGQRHDDRCHGGRQNGEGMEAHARELLEFDGKVRLEGDAVPDGKFPVTIAVRGKGTLYYSVQAEYFTTEEHIAAAGNEIYVERSYEKQVREPAAGSTGAVAKDRYEPIRDGDTLVSGDEVRVTLRLKSLNDYEYLVFEDPKPAGMEPVALQSGSTYAGGLCSNMELRDELVAFFVSRLPQGERSISYNVRAEIPGTFHAVPATGYAMYTPDLRANAASFVIKVKDVEAKK